MQTLTFDYLQALSAKIAILTICCSVNERTEMKQKIYLSEAWIYSEFGYQRAMSNTIGLKEFWPGENF